MLKKKLSCFFFQFGRSNVMNINVCSSTDVNKMNDFKITIVNFIEIILRK